MNEKNHNEWFLRVEARRMRVPEGLSKGNDYSS